MGIILGLLGIILIGGIIVRLGGGMYDDGWGMLGIVIMGVATIFLVILLIGMPIMRQGHLGDIARYEAIKDSLKIARANSDISEFELAALQTEVIKINKWVASAKFWSNHKLTNWFWHPKIQELEFIK